MKKTYISSLMVAMMAGATAVWAQSADDFAAFDEISDAAMPDVVVMEETTSTAAGGVEAMTVEQLLNQGITQFESGKFEEAKVSFKIVLEKEEYNSTAMDYLTRVYIKIKALEREKRNLTRQEMIAEIEEQWGVGNKGLLIVQKNVEDEAETKEDIAREKMIKRLKDTVISAVEFKGDLSIQNAVIYLAEECRRNGDNVNMVILGLQNADGMDAGYEGNNIRLTVENMSLYKTLGVITEMADLRFEVDEDTVYIMPYDYERPINMVEESIKISKSVGEKLAEYAGPSDDGGLEEVDSIFGGGDISSSVSLTGPVELDAYVEGLNITCPSRSAVTYYPSSNEVYVRNTAANIKKIKKQLDAIQSEIYFDATQQVKIEAKFVEFSEGDLKEIGLDWIVKGTGSAGGFNLSSGTSFGSTYVDNINVQTVSNIGTLNDTVKAVAGNSEGLFTGGARTSVDAYETLTSGILSSMGNGGIIPSMIFDRGDVAAKLSMLEQEGTADVLSCPSVTTMSGEEAIMRVVEIHRYPQDYDVETGQRTAPIVKPQDWEDFDLGVVLRVMPDINDNGTITMKLDPEIRKFKGFEDYAVAINSYLAESGTDNDATYAGDNSTLYARMPYFEIRSVSTRVTVADGHTVVMGGLIDERTETFRDQVPILGDIPYLGKLFRHEGVRSEKKNLVVYVKATQVDVRGMSIEENDLALQASM